MGSHGPGVLHGPMDERRWVGKPDAVRLVLDEFAHDVIGLECNISMDDIQLWKHYMEIPDYLILIRCLEPHEIQCAKVDTLIFTV